MAQRAWAAPCVRVVGGRGSYWNCEGAPGWGVQEYGRRGGGGAEGVRYFQYNRERFGVLLFFVAGGGATATGGEGLPRPRERRQYAVAGRGGRRGVGQARHTAARRA